MKKIFLLAFFVLTTTIYSQELDEIYLQSLPEDIRSDVLDKIEAKETLINLFTEEHRLLLIKRNTKIDDQSLLFGSNFFDVMQTSFMPINEPNLDSSYILRFWRCS